MWARRAGTAARAGAATCAGLTAAVCGGTRDRPACAGKEEPTRQSRSILEQVMHPPPFSMDGQRFDMSSYPGRACHFLNVLGDLTTLFLTRERVDEHLCLLRQFEAEGH